MFERHSVHVRHQLLGLAIQDLQRRMHHPVLPLHLFDQELRVRSENDLTIAVLNDIPERGEEAVVFGYVVGSYTERPESS